MNSAGSAPGKDNLATLVPGFQQMRDDFRGVLETGIESHDGPSLGGCEAGTQGSLGGEATREDDTPDGGVLLTELIDEGGGSIGATIVHVEDFVGNSQPF